MYRPEPDRPRGLLKEIIFESKGSVGNYYFKKKKKKKKKDREKAK